MIVCHNTHIKAAGRLFGKDCPRSYPDYCAMTLLKLGSHGERFCVFAGKDDHVP